MTPVQTYAKVEREVGYALVRRSCTQSSSLGGYYTKSSVGVYVLPVYVCSVVLGRMPSGQSGQFRIVVGNSFVSLPTEIAIVRKSYCSVAVGLHPLAPALGVG